ncbi:unnamed protein product, partial [Laminaria digitata]
NRKQRSAFLVELQHMRRLKSPHIVNVFGIITSIEKRLVLVMEFMPGGDLYEFIITATGSVLSGLCLPIPGQVARRIIREVAEGMAFLHQKKTWHGDLKSLNVLLDAKDRAKVGNTGKNAKRHLNPS